MHRHGYQGRKLHRDGAQRTALLRGLSISLIEHGKVETTLPKAKEVVPFLEVLITKAKKGDLASRRAVIGALNSPQAGSMLVDLVAPQLAGRDSGHLRIKRSRLRVGDNAQLAHVSFVDEIKRDVAEKAEPVAKKPAPAKAKKVEAKKS